VLTQVFENAKIEEAVAKAKTEIKESSDLDAFFNKYTMTFF
jgi:hypothetical protein